MKRVFAFLLIAAMMLSVSVVMANANEVNEMVEFRDEEGNPIAYTAYDAASGQLVTKTDLQNGVVPKVDDGIISIDGLQETAYYQGLRANVTRVQGGADTGDAPAGEVWLVYDDNYLYAFVKIDDKTPFHIADKIHICEVCGKQWGAQSKCEHMTAPDQYNGHDINLWDDDCIEMMVDWKDNGSVPSQYRISRDGFMSRDWDTKDTGFSGKGFDNGANGWSAEFAVALDSSKQGTRLGLTFMLHSMTELYDNGKYVESYCMMNSSACFGGPWESNYFDSIELGARIEGKKDPIVNPGDPRESDPGVSGNPGDPTPSGSGVNPTDKGPIKGPVQTGDPIVMIVLASVAALGAAVVVKKTCFGK